MENNRTIESFALFIWTTTLLATIGSLYYSEIKGFIPCDYCWYQRILMYPNFVIFTVFLLRKNKEVIYPSLFLSGIGILVSTYHYLIQKLPMLDSLGTACGIIPCNTTYVNYFGFITIPFMALVSFIIIMVGSILLIKKGGNK